MSTSNLRGDNDKIIMKSLLGSRNEITTPIYADQIQSLISRKNPMESRELILGISLKTRDDEDNIEYQSKIFKQIIEILEKKLLY